MEDMTAVIGRVFETVVDHSSRWEHISINLRYGCDLHASALVKYPTIVGKSERQLFFDLLRKFSNRIYRTHEGCRLEIGDAKHLNPIARPIRFNRVNPIQAVPCYDPKDKQTNKEEPFSLIRLRTRMFIAIFGSGGDAILNEMVKLVKN
ncbi:hypothetical protein X798_02159 [Onchocerca flexuosa]|uniref:Uncharacterized protein n=1 Tax=Onchocerca flexuosa TaxID=387005 RepID=A0A238BZP2_9BILA|nr:hypothetical protein X798_02159 [Onchocerca flexuosa]